MYKIEIIDIDRKNNYVYIAYQNTNFKKWTNWDMYLNQLEHYLNRKVIEGEVIDLDISSDYFWGFLMRPADKTA